MNKKSIENYLLKRGINPSQRVDKNNGGQYLTNFLIEFSNHVRNLTLDDVSSDIKKIRKFYETKS